MHNDEITQHYYTLLMHCYLRELERTDLNNMEMLANQIIEIAEQIQAYIPDIVEQLMTQYRQQKNNHILESIVAFISNLKDKLSQHPDTILPLEKALAECSELALNAVSDAGLLSADDTKAVEDAVESFKQYAEHAEGDLKEVYIKKHADALLLKAESLLNQGNYDEALNDFTEAYKNSGSVTALNKIAHIQADIGERDAAIESYKTLSTHPDIKNDFHLLHSALQGLSNMYDELPEKSAKRIELSNLVKSLLHDAVDADIASEQFNIKSSQNLQDFNHYLKIANDDFEIKVKMLSISEEITPAEKEKAKEDERIAQIQKLIDSTKNSSKRHIATLINLFDTEKPEGRSATIIRDAIYQWLEKSVKVERDHVFIKDEDGITQLAKRGIMAATYYLARHLAQENKYQTALSLCARIYMTPQQIDSVETTATIKSLARGFIEECAGQQAGKGINKYFSNQEKLISYAKDLLEVINKPAVSVDPDAAIETPLHEKPLGVDSSYNKYVLDISLIGLKSSATRPQRASDRHQKI